VAVVVEIRHEERAVRVRQFGSGGSGAWSVVEPGGRDERLTRRGYDELARLEDGVWEFPDGAGSA
jgi:hypothetical protein